MRIGRSFRIQRLDHRATIPRRAHHLDAAYDLISLEPLSLRPGIVSLASTGLALAVPSGHAGLVLPRSGLALDHSITVLNAPGLIDPGYTGEIQILLINLGRRDVHLAAGARVAQLLLLPLARVRLREVRGHVRSVRGSQGFGSTG